MIFLFFGTSLALLEAELAPFKDWQHLRFSKIPLDSPRWWWWRFWWSKATRLLKVAAPGSPCDRGKNGVKWKIWKILYSGVYNMQNVFVFVFVYLSFFPFCLCLGRRSSLERLLSNSRVAFDHQNRHHHHQMNGLNLGQNKGPLNGVPPAKTCFGNDLGVVIPA